MPSIASAPSSPARHCARVQLSGWGGGWAALVSRAANWGARARRAGRISRAVCAGAADLAACDLVRAGSGPLRPLRARRSRRFFPALAGR